VRTIEGAPVGQLQPALRKALRDPGLEIVFRRGDGHVREDGADVRVSADARPGGAAAGWRSADRVVLHDASLTDEPQFVAR